jgi:hypothetical protein
MSINSISSASKNKNSDLEQANSKEFLTNKQFIEYNNAHAAKENASNLKNKIWLVYFVCVLLTIQIVCVNVYVYLIINYAISNKIQLNQINLTLNIFIAGTLASIFILVKIIVTHFFKKQ